MILVLGANGQLGFELKRLLKEKGKFLERTECDLTDESALELLFNKYHFTVLINAAAYTQVDKAEEERELALKINTEAPGILAQMCLSKGIKYVHFSTDYVFDGESETPYAEGSIISPVNFYGESKAMGEKIVMEFNPDALILRTSWVYSSHGNNFVKTMIKFGNTKDELRVVSDQFGSPTWAHELAQVALMAIERNLTGIYHYSQAGKCSWADFALEIKRLTGFKAQITPIKSHEYPTKAKRPKFSLLSKEKIIKDLGIEIPDWKESLQIMIQDFLKTP